MALSHILFRVTSNGFILIYGFIMDLRNEIKRPDRFYSIQHLIFETAVKLIKIRQRWSTGPLSIQRLREQQKS